VKRMAGTTRLELATSAVTGQRSNQLNYVPNRGINVKTLQTNTLQGLHTVHRLPGVHAVASVPAKTAHKNQRAHASFILTQMRFIRHVRALFPLYSLLAVQSLLAWRHSPFGSWTRKRRPA
jgi:hypothetical protein